MIPAPLPVVQQRLTTNVEAVKLYRFSRQHAPYQGTISEQGFQISRIIHSRNSFLPIIRGSFESKSYETAVHVQMSFHPIVMGFLGIWFLCWYSATIPISLAEALHVNMRFVFLGMPLIMLVIFWLTFWSEVNRSRRDLIQILQGQIIEK
ncbi:MAG TPA: hypothetical protein VK203_05990 [Nostocaceae cyanobacterium]|nr:hypothetical protein [Nostocaceae cyanobacterium]